MGAAPNAIDDKGYTPLFYAAMSNNVGTAETLLRRGADLDLRAKRCGRGPLHIAAMFGSDDVIKLLLDKVYLLTTARDSCHLIFHFQT